MYEKKVCTKCKIEKPLSEFSKNKRNKSGYEGRCKKCITEYQLAYREKFKEKLKEKNKIYRDKNKEKNKPYHKAYRENNREKLREKSKDYYHNNKEKLKENNKSYYEANKDAINNQKKVYRQENIEKFKEIDKRYYYTNKEKIRRRRKVYRETNKEVLDIKNKEWREANKDYIREYQREYKNKKLKGDPLFKLYSNVRCLIRNSIKQGGWEKKTRTHEILGCDYATFEQHLNNNPYNFKVGDSNLDLDHIVPLSTATTEEDVLALNHYTNFQLLPSKYNRDVKFDKPWNKEDFENWLSENWSWEY
jgi:hypothetical protein